MYNMRSIGKNKDAEPRRRAFENPFNNQEPHGLPGREIVKHQRAGQPNLRLIELIHEPRTSIVLSKNP